MSHTKNIDQAAVLTSVLEIAHRTGQLLARSKPDTTLTQKKRDGSLLTKADLQADAFAREKLYDLALDIPIISEESPVPDFSVRKYWNMFWLVDALDGTKEYVAGLDEYTVNIALIRDGAPLLGVIYAPEKKLLYYASQTSGSWKSNENGLAPLRIYSKPPEPEVPLIVIESKSHPSAMIESYLQTLQVQKRIKMGSSLKFCILAEGSAHIYPRFGPTMEWDVAAGDCIFRYSGRDKPRHCPFQYNKEDMTNEAFVIGLA